MTACFIDSKANIFFGFHQKILKQQRRLQNNNIKSI